MAAGTGSTGSGGGLESFIPNICVGADFKFRTEDGYRGRVFSGGFFGGSKMDRDGIE